MDYDNYSVFFAIFQYSIHSMDSRKQMYNLSLSQPLNNYSLMRKESAAIRGYRLTILNRLSDFRFALLTDYCQNTTMPTHLYRDASYVLILKLNGRNIYRSILVSYRTAHKFQLENTHEYTTLMTRYNKDELTLLQQYIKTLEAENQTRNKERASLQRQLDNVLAQNNLLRSQKYSGDFNRILADKDREIADLKKELAVAKANASAATTVVMHNSSNNIETNKLKQDLERLNSEILQKNNQIFNLKAEKTASQSSWDSQRRNLQNQIVTLKSSLSSALATTTISTSSTIEITELKRELEAVKQRQIKADIDLMVSLSQLKQKEAEITRLRGEVMAYRTDSDRLKTIYSEFQHQKSSYLQQITRLTQNVEELRSEVSRVQIERNSVLNELKVTRSEDAHIECKRRDETSRNDILALTSEIERLTQIVERSRNVELEYGQAKFQLVNLSAANQALNNQILILRSAVATTQQERGQWLALVETNKQLEKRIFVLESANYNLSQELQKVLNNSSSILKAPAMTNTQLETVIASLKNDLLQYKLQNQRLTRLVSQGVHERRTEESVMMATSPRRSSSQTKNLYASSAVNFGIPSQLTQEQRYRTAQKVQEVGLEDIGSAQERKQRVRTTTTVPHPANVVDRQKWNNLQKRINALKSENEELKKSLSFSRH